MQREFSFGPRAIVVALALAGSVGFAGAGYAADNAGTSRNGNLATQNGQVRPNAQSADRTRDSGAFDGNSATNDRSQGNERSSLRGSASRIEGSTMTGPGANGSSGAVAGSSLGVGVTPGKSELASSAFGKLDTQQKGYVTHGDLAAMDGFDDAFSRADANGDGRLDRNEFNQAWSLYTGNPAR